MTLCGRPGPRSLAQHNLTQLLGHCVLVGLLGADLGFSFLQHLKARFSEVDVQAMVRRTGPCGDLVSCGLGCDVMQCTAVPEIHTWPIACPLDLPH